MSDQPEPDSVSKRLIASLEAEADFVDDGRFSVDLARAGINLGRFALADSDAWVLLLVEVASLLEVTRIGFHFEQTGVTVVLDGPTLSRSELQGLSAWALAREGQQQDDRRRRARKQLALAYLALRAREVARICIVGAPVDKPAFMLDCVGSNERFTSLTTRPEPGMRFSVGFGQGDRDRERAQRERALLEARCNCSPVPVQVDGASISKGWTRIFGEPSLDPPEQFDVSIQIPVELDDTVIGVAGFHSSETTGAFVRVLVDGVMVEDIPLEGQPDFRAIVETDLRRDLGNAKLLRDDRFAAIMAAVEWARLEAGVRRGVPARPAQMALAAKPTKQAVRRHWIRGNLLLFLAWAFVFGVAAFASNSLIFAALYSLFCVVVTGLPIKRQQQ